jgi:hypothetical protein
VIWFRRLESNQRTLVSKAKDGCHHRLLLSELVGALGIEPRSRASKAPVLPLDDAPVKVTPAGFEPATSGLKDQRPNL